MSNSTRKTLSEREQIKSHRVTDEDLGALPVRDEEEPVADAVMEREARPRDEKNQPRRAEPDHEGRRIEKKVAQKAKK